ncbi:hypothetical protein AB0M80_35375 [Amycolatopsis sp. NPDC051045]|uniref:hypothetical protein n=1 Tax=Amycolatopsis sp. NPDC051045 TaxID=3156922 RepID=UPI00342E2098
MTKVYRQLASWLQEQAGIKKTPTLDAGARKMFLLHPLQLSYFLEEAWYVRNNSYSARPSFSLDDPTIPGPDPGYATRTARRSSSMLASRGSFVEDWVLDSTNSIYPLGKRVQTGLWDHLIYAYLIENTRIYEIFRRVIHEYAHGERLDVPSVDGQHWLRATEDLFFKDAPPGSIQSLTSYVRSDICASRRNAYWRMFGMDLNHGTKDGGRYPYEQAEAYNRDFVPTFEKLLTEVWRGIENFTNTTGPRATDDSAIANLAQHLFNMLSARRRSGNLSREEFFYVATMSWLHLTVEFDSPIVADLKATAPSPEERLRKIGERVGVPAHAKSESHFRMAQPAASVLAALETGVFNDPAGAQALYILPTAGNPIRNDMQTIITHWSLATGRDVKAMPVRGGVSPSPNGHVQPAVTGVL